MADIPVYKSKWQLQKDETFRIRFQLNETDGKRVKFVVEESRNNVEHWVEFRMWDYNAMVNLRKMATTYHKESGTFYVDTDKFNDLKIKFLLKDWSFSQIDPQMKLTHNKGALVDESFQLFRNLYPWVVSEIIARMNAILEGYEIKQNAE